MVMPSISRGLAALALSLCSVTGAHAVALSFSGQLMLNSDVAASDFTLGNGLSNIRIWTDSYQGGVNFDPTLALWQRDGTDYELVAQNDDDSTIGAGQSAFDAGLAFASLGAGDYRVTVTASPHFAAGNLLSSGFAFDPAYGPIDATPIAQWNQPSYDLNTNNQKGINWSLQVTAVPEPTTWLLMALGLAATGTVARRRGATLGV